VRIEPRLTEVALVVRDPEPDGVEADTVLLAFVDGQLRRSGRLEHGRRKKAVELVDVTEPHVLHVVNAVEEELDVRWMAGGRRIRELWDDGARVHERRCDLDAVLLLELLQRVRHPALDADRLLLPPPPHLQRRRALPSHRASPSR